MFDITGISCYLGFAAIQFSRFCYDDERDVNRISSYSDYLLTFAMGAGIFRGIVSGFKIFPATRFIMEMMILVLKKIVAFLAVYIGVIFYFTVMFWQSQQHGENFISSGDDFSTIPPLLRGLMAVWNLGMGSMEYAFKTVIGCFLYFLATLISVIVMLNLLISVVGDNYDLLQM